MKRQKTYYQLLLFLISIFISHQVLAEPTLVTDKNLKRTGKCIYPILEEFFLMDDYLYDLFDDGDEKLQLSMLSLYLDLEKEATNKCLGRIGIKYSKKALIGNQKYVTKKLDVTLQDAVLTLPQKGTVEKTKSKDIVYVKAQFQLVVKNAEIIYKDCTILCIIYNKIIADYVADFLGKKIYLDVVLKKYRKHSQHLGMKIAKNKLKKYFLHSKDEKANKLLKYLMDNHRQTVIDVVKTLNIEFERKDEK